MIVLEKIGERLPLEAQQEAIASIAKAKASYALAALRHVNFSGHWREALLRRSFPTPPSRTSKLRGCRERHWRIC